MPLPKFKDWSLGAKLSSVQALVILLLVGLGSVSLAMFLRDSMEEKSLQDLRQRNILVVRLLERYFDSIDHGIEQGSTGFRQALAEPFSVHPTETIQIGDRHTVGLYAGGTRLNLNFDIVDRYSALTGNVATIFLKQGNDYVRIATSLKNEKGERAIGTLLDANHPAYAKLRDGQGYSGLARLFGRDYLTRYAPVTGPGGEVVAVLFVGLDITESFAAVKQTVRDMKIGTTGYAYILDASPAKAGTLIVHPAKEGQSILDAKDASGHAFIKEILDNKQGVIHYPWTNPGETSAREKVVVYEPFKAMNWVVASGSHLDEINRDGTRILTFMLIGTGVTLALIVALLVLVTRRWVTLPLRAAASAAGRLAEGDLMMTLTSDSGDETGRLLAAMSNMTEKLKQIIGEVNATADSLGNASEEISSTAQSLAQASSEQAASVEEMSASVEEMSASISQNARNSGVTREMADNAALAANQGGGVVKGTVEAMRQIADKIGIVDDIAYQTNMLALNAAIEAARAGEHGKGFAVVAAEVRKLAERSQVAAREIGELAGTSVGTAEKAGTLIDEIVPAITKTSDLVRDIASASDEQSAGVGQINAAMGQLNQTTQQNASASEQLAATAEEMGAQAGQLQSLMQFFKLTDSKRPARSVGSGATPAARVFNRTHVPVDTHFQRF